MRVMFLVVFLGACSQSLGSLQAVSVSAATASVPPSGPRVRGESCGSSLMGLPIGAPSLEGAARAAQRARGAAGDLQDVRVSRTSWSIGIYGKECLVVDAAR